MTCDTYVRMVARVWRCERGWFRPSNRAEWMSIDIEGGRIEHIRGDEFTCDMYIQLLGMERAAVCLWCAALCWGAAPRCLSVLGCCADEAGAGARAADKQGDEPIPSRPIPHMHAVRGGTDGAGPTGWAWLRASAPSLLE